MRKQQHSSLYSTLKLTAILFVVKHSFILCMTVKLGSFEVGGVQRFKTDKTLDVLTFQGNCLGSSFVPLERLNAIVNVSQCSSVILSIQTQLEEDLSRVINSGGPKNLEFFTQTIPM